MRTLLVAVCLLACNRGSTDQIEFRGQMFKLKHAYATYEDYKDDSDNLAPGEAARASQVIRAMAVPTQLDGRRALIHVMFELQFPGYGLAAFGETQQADGTVLSAYAIELPQSGNSRILVYRGVRGHYVLADDFVESDDKGISTVRAEGGKLIYSTMQGQTVLLHKMR